MKYLIFITFLVISSGIYATEKEIMEVLPPNNLYDPPIADPRWPKFLIGIDHDYNGTLGKNIWSFSFGENIGLIKFGNSSKPYEFGVQAATYGYMDVSSDPTRLLDQDYFFAFGISHVNGSFQQLFQLYHFSTHLGDEFLLSAQGRTVNRINLSYETLRWYGRYKSKATGFTPYVSFGYIFHLEPSYLNRFITEAGLDFYSKKIIFKDSTRLIAGADYTSLLQNNFSGTFTVRAGLQYERTRYCNRFLQLLLQYSYGKSQMGQFYNLNMNSLGIVVAFSS